ncbi:MAG: hypothetical protein EOM67_16615 [Spirochaetia bacterium]|jgi:hypothetical protein|nr:hypothetical protein [Spirochaetia bacterium]
MFIEKDNRAKGNYGSNFVEVYRIMENDSEFGRIALMHDRTVGLKFPAITKKMDITFLKEMVAFIEQRLNDPNFYQQGR